VKPLLIIPGMVATVDIITGHKSVLDYLLKPVLKARTGAMRERSFRPVILLVDLLPHRRNLPFDQRFERL
jgi:hypothetical protein